MFECDNFSPTELIRLLHDGQEIVSTLNEVVLYPSGHPDMTRNATTEWIQAMHYFEDIFQSRKSHFIL
jgi:hypothetical protein